MAEARSKISFEDALVELEQIAEKLERQDFSLEESLKAYERGMELKKNLPGNFGFCRRKDRSTYQGRIEKDKQNRFSDRVQNDIPNFL